MERKIGEIFEHNGEWYQCVDWDVNPCSKCDFDGEGICSDELPCTSSQRKDKKYVFFKKLEKVGEPYAEGNSICSRNIGRMKRISFSMKGICCSQVMGTLLV